MLHRICLFIISSLFIQNIEAQSLYIPRDVQHAFKKETRSPDGRPGKNYWQNTARYNITVSALPPGRNISGNEVITYFNNSPDTMKRIVMRLMQNIHKPGSIRNGDIDSAYLTQGVFIDGFRVNGKERPWDDDAGNNTWKMVDLGKSLLPHDSVQLVIEWHYRISLESNREGMIDSTTFFLAYFYPRVAVYDDYLGWDRMDFTDQQEFYNDFNDYTLNVIVPKNYIVWATGDLQNASKVLQPTYVQRLEQSMTSDDIIHVATLSELASNTVTTQNAVNTWTWKASNISDMTLGLSDHFVWDASSVVVDDATHRRASVQSAFNDTAADFHSMVGFGRHSLDWLSHNWPGVPYPFPKTTIFQGYADMEYPMMVNDGTNKDTVFSRFVVEHEIAHTWFPFYMGINESRYAFMDEGWATTFELLIGRADLGTERAEGFFKQFRINGWIHDPSAEEDMPIITPANVVKNAAYGNNAYGKPALAYLAVKDILGDDMFRKCLHEYMNRWHGKHPTPWDFFNTFNDVSEKNLNWFWSNWYFSNYYIDLAIQSVNKSKQGYTVTIQNIGGFAAPVDIIANFSDGTFEIFHQTPEIWSTDQKQATVNLNTKKTIQSVQLKGGIYMDADESNNVWKAP